MWKLNAVYRYEGEQKRRLVYVHDENEFYVFMPLQEGSNPIVLFKEQLALEEQSYQQVADPYAYLASASSTATPAAIKRRNKADQAVSELLKHVPQIFFPGNRIAILQEVAEKVGATRQSLMSWLRRWWTGGQIKSALLPNFDRCGRYDPKNAKQAARGARPRLLDRDKYRLTETDRRAITVYIRRYYLKKGSKYSLAATHKKLLDQRYSLPDDDGYPVNLPEGKRPSFRQFEYLYRQSFPYEVRRRARKGKVQFDLTERAKLESVIKDCFGPGHYYELDATVDNTHLKCRFDLARNIGRATVYFIRDRWSRFVPGFYVTLDAPSWIGAMSALVSIGEDKEELCKKYGIPYNPDDWPTCGYPQFIVVDRGEGISKASDHVVNDLGIAIASPGAFRADLKPVVENNHRLYQRTIQADTPGYKVPSKTTRGPKSKEELEAALTFDEFVKLIFLTVWKMNTTHIGDYPLSPEMVADGVLPIPAEIMRWGLSHRSGRLRHLDHEHVKLQLLPRGMATVTDGGIRFKGCFYSFDRAIREGWFSRARGRSWREQVSYDPRLVDQIYLRDPKRRDGGCEVLRLRDKSREYQGCSFAEVEENELRKRQLAAKAKEDSSARESQYIARTGDINDTARKRAAQATSQLKSKTEILKNKKGLREEERAARHAEQAHRLGQPEKSRGTPAEVVTLRPVEDAAPELVAPIPGSVDEATQANLEKLINGEPFAAA